MAQITVEEIKSYADKVVAEFADGFTWTDLFTIVPMVMEIVEKVEGASGEEKKATAVEIINYVIDVADFPGPDVILDPILKKAAPFVIELIIKATSGTIAVNKPQA
jgi:hypothetical protein